MSDDPITGFGWFFYIDSQVAPFTNLACRQAIEYAANHLTLQNAYGGPIAGGAIGSTVLPPTVAGYQKFDLYEATTKTQGDPAKAKQQLQACGQPNGFSTGIAYRSDRPTETQGAQALQQALSAVGIKTTLHGFPTATLLQQLRGRAQVHGRAQHRDRLRRLGCRLAGRLRLPRRAGRREHHRPGGQHQHRDAQRPGGQQPVHQGRGHHRRAPAERDLAARSTSRS